MELAIDTSSNTASVTLSRKGEISTSLTWQTAQNHTTELLPNLTFLLRRAGAEISSLEAIIVARGPGSFNGLRVGISTAKGLAIVLTVPLLGVNALEAEAYPFAFTKLPLRPIQRAGRDEIATALYRQEGDSWQCLEATNLTTVESMCRRTGHKTLFCGDIPTDIIDAIRQQLGKKAIISGSNTSFRARTLALLGWRKLSDGERDDPITLQPLYLRPPHITKPKTKVPPFITTTETRETRT